MIDIIRYWFQQLPVGGEHINVNDNLTLLFSWGTVLGILVAVLLFFLLLGSKKDAYDRLVKKRKRALKKEERLHKKIERRNRKNARKYERAIGKDKYRTYDGSGDYR